jgi:hypothetical protein
MGEDEHNVDTEGDRTGPSIPLAGLLVLDLRKSAYSSLLLK